MPRHLLVHVDPDTGLWLHRYGNGEARIVVLKPSRGLTIMQLEELNAMLDLALEKNNGPECARMLGPLIDGLFPESRVQVWLDTRTGPLH